MILQDASPNIRLQLIAARIEAHNGDIDSALSAIAALVSDPMVASSPNDLLAARLLKAELLYLDEREPEAFSELKETTASLSKATPPTVEMSVRRNLVSIGTSMSVLDADSSRDFYSLVDEQRLAGINLRDTTSVLDAKEAAVGGKHYDTLPALWKEYERTFRQGCWPLWRWAASNLADECAQIGILYDAAIFAVYSLDEHVAEKIGEMLLMRGRRDEIREVLVWITGHALLWRHHAVACSLVAKVADAVQSAEIPLVFEWVLRGCRRTAKDGYEQSRLTRAWKCAAAISPLLSEREAKSLCETAMSHGMWTEFSVNRVLLRNAIGPCVPVLPADIVELLVANLAEQLDTAAEKETEDDFIKTVNLLAYAIERCNEETKLRVATRLFPKGKSLPWTLVAAAPKLLAGQPLHVDWEKSIEPVLHYLRNEVQHLKAGEEPTPVSFSLMQHHETLANGEARLIHISSLVPLQALLKHRARVADDRWNDLIEALVNGVANSLNLLTNRIQHTKLLGRAAEHLGEAQRVRIFDVLSPIARGRISVDLDEMTEEQANNPLNRYRIRGGTPEELQAVAIQTLAMIEKAHPESYGRRLNRIIADGLMSSHRAIRPSAVFAWAETPKRASIPALLVLLATRDPVLEVAAMAIEAFGATNGHSLSMKEFNGLIDSCRVAASSNNAELRGTAAYCLSRIKSALPSAKLQKIADSLLNTLSADICFSVRRQVDRTSNHS